MARVLMVGIDPDEVDFSDPALPPGMNADVIRRGVGLGVERLQASGREVDQLYISIRPERAVGPLEARLASGAFDCVLIGGGVHFPPRNRPLFEAVLNVIGRCTPTPAIALIPRPEDTVEGADRVLA